MHLPAFKVVIVREGDPKLMMIYVLNKMRVDFCKAFGRLLFPDNFSVLITSAGSSPAPTEVDITVDALIFHICLTCF